MEEFNKDDIVVCIVNPQRSLGNISDNDRQGAGWAEGKIYTVSYVDRNNIMWPTEGGCGIYKDCVKKIQGKKITWRERIAYGIHTKP